MRTGACVLALVLVVCGSAPAWAAEPTGGITALENELDTLLVKGKLSCEVFHAAQDGKKVEDVLERLQAVVKSSETPAQTRAQAWILMLQLAQNRRALFAFADHQACCDDCDTVVSMLDERIETWSASLDEELARLGAAEKKSVCVSARKRIPSLDACHDPPVPETRCGWLDNPTPGNFWLYDADGEWTLGIQGGYQAELEVEDDFPPQKKGWVQTNGPYGYGCVCMRGIFDVHTHRVVKVLSAESLRIARCNRDPKLPDRPGTTR